MKKIKFIQCFAVYLFPVLIMYQPTPCFAQTKDKNHHKLDSLQNELVKATTDTARLSLLKYIDRTYYKGGCDDTIGWKKNTDAYIALAQKLQRDEEYLDALGDYGDIYNNACFYNGRMAIFWYDSVARIAHKMGNREKEINALNSIAEIYKKNAEFNKALTVYRKCVEMNVDDNPISSLANMGEIYSTMGDYPKAADCYERSFNLLNQKMVTGKNNTKNDTITVLLLLNALAEVDMSMSQYDKALANYHVLLKRVLQEKNKSTDNKTIEMFALIGLGKCYQAINDFAKAIENNKEALAISKETEQLTYEAEILNHLGNCYFEEGDNDKALDYARQSLAVHMPNGYQESVPDNYLLLGKVYTKQTNYTKAVGSLQQAISLYHKAGAMSSESDAWKALSRTYEQMGRITDAYSAYKHHISLRDSVFSQEKALQITRVTMQGDFDREQIKKDAEVTLKIQQKDAAAKLKMQQQKVYTIGGYAGLALVLLLSFFMYRNYTHEKKANIAITKASEQIKEEKQVSDGLLRNILPEEVADELKKSGVVTAKQFEDVTVIITDFVNFTSASERLGAKGLVTELHTCFKAFDRIIDKYSIEKIKTVGDAYIAASGVPNPNPNHASDIVKAAIEMRDYMKARQQELGNQTFGMRIGINSGTVVAGVVGVKKFAYDIWGDTVNIAARMEQYGEPGKINISQCTYELVQTEFKCTDRGEIDTKNKGKMRMYFVEG